MEPCPNCGNDEWILDKCLNCGESIWLCTECGGPPLCSHCGYVFSAIRRNHINTSLELIYFFSPINHSYTFIPIVTI